MAKFRKKPVVIEATQFNFAGDHPSVIVAAKTDAGEIRMMGGGRPCFALKTLEGWHEVSQGDWIITGVKGELYPCKPDIFAATYDVAGDQPVPCWCPYCSQPHSVAQRAAL